MYENPLVIGAFYVTVGSMLLWVLLDGYRQRSGNRAAASASGIFYLSGRICVTAACTYLFVMYAADLIAVDAWPTKIALLFPITLFLLLAIDSGLRIYLSVVGDRFGVSDDSDFK